jgi:hypothetical protein
VKGGRAADDLILWLRHQLDDDERVARRVEPNQAPVALRAMVTREGSAPFLIIDSARLLAEIDAKRRVVRLYENALRAYNAGSISLRNRTQDEAAVDVLRAAVIALAQPYAELPGWREEWRLDWA